MYEESDIIPKNHHCLRTKKRPYLSQLCFLFICCLVHSWRGISKGLEKHNVAFLFFLLVFLLLFFKFWLLVHLHCKGALVVLPNFYNAAQYYAAGEDRKETRIEALKKDTVGGAQQSTATRDNSMPLSRLQYYHI